MINRIISEDLANIIERLPDLEKLRGKTILITGAAGFIAAYLVETCLKLNEKYENFGVKVVGVVRNRIKAEERFRDYLLRSDLELIEADASSYIPDRQINFVVHAASQASPRFYGIDPVGTIEPNVIGTRNLLEYCRKVSVEGFLFFSSGEVYGMLPNMDKSTRESDGGFVDPLIVRNCYAESKRMGETLCVSYWKQFGVPAKIVRPFHTYGPGMSLLDGRVFADFVSCVVRSQNIVLWSDGSAIRPFCYLTDAVRGFFTVLLTGRSGEAYNVGNPSAEISIRGLAERLIRLYPERGLSVSFETRRKSDAYLPSSIARNCPDVSKAKGLGWLPTVGIDEGFRRTIDSFELV